MITVSKGERPLVISQTARIHFTGHASSRADGLRIAFFLSFFCLSFFLKFSLPTLLTSLPPSFPHYPSLRPDSHQICPSLLPFISFLALPYFLPFVLALFHYCLTPSLLSIFLSFYPSLTPSLPSYSSALIWIPPVPSPLDPSLSQSFLLSLLTSFPPLTLSSLPFFFAQSPSSLCFPLFALYSFPYFPHSFSLTFLYYIPSLPPPSPFFPCLSSTSHPHFLSSSLILFPSSTFPSLPSLALSLLLTSFLFFSISPSLALLYLPCLPFISFLWSFPSFLPFHCFFTLKTASIDASSSASFNYNQPVWRQRGQNTADIQ